MRLLAVQAILKQHIETSGGGWFFRSRKNFFLHLAGNATLLFRERERTLLPVKPKLCLLFFFFNMPFTAPTPLTIPCNGLCAALLSHVVGTFSVGWPPLLVQIGGAVLLEGPGIEELSAAGEEGLLFFLGVCSQHLFGQSQTLVGLLFLAGRGHHANRQSRRCGALCYVLNNLCRTKPQTEVSVKQNLLCWWFHEAFWW